MNISIIIPVYNVEKYIEKCLFSCIHQDLQKTDYEIIVINDGSPDNSLSIAERISNNQPNVSIISQENQGLSGARNTGLKAAKGDFVWFVDSDDWIEENCLGKVVASLRDCDVLAIDFIWAYDDATKNQVVSYGETGTLQGKDFLKRNYHTQAQMYVYSRRFLIDNNLTFLPGVYHEDTEFTPRALYLAKNVRYLNSPVYFFYKRPNSISTVPNPKRAFDYIIVANSLNNFSKNVDCRFKTCFYDRIARNISNALGIIAKANNAKQNEFFKELKGNRQVLKAMGQSSIFRYRVMGRFLYLLPYLSFKVFTRMK